MGTAPALGDRPLPLSEVVSALSYALDITEGQPEGHAVRTCMIGMRIAREIYLLPKQRSALFYALLLKDLGCSSNASKIATLFGACDQKTKCDLKTTNWARPTGRIGFVLRNVSPRESLLSRVSRFMKVARSGAAAARDLVETRCERGAAIARTLLMPEETAAAIQSLDEHWNGQGHPRGLAGEDIPMLARIMNLAQTAEVFYRRDGLDGMLAMAQARSGQWFDPDLVKALAAARADAAFWDKLHSKNLLAEAMAFEPQELAVTTTDDHLDRLAAGFSQVIDAKSPWTFRHSEGVAVLAFGIAEVMGFSEPALRKLRRAALVHDIGKLGVSNLVLDKPGKLEPPELAAMHKHPYFTRQILSRVSGFAELANIAAAHHERLDGKGYDRGLDASNLSTEVRILTISDMFEALASRRPYRQDLTEEEVMAILTRNLGTAVDPACFEALKLFLEKSQWEPVELAA
ncbi:MAG TPA: HD domain-containing phosphohydrolase [Phycisphaerae bacterium]|nr:HD domain-containing phosphohydrolase [Phycisphaerae bacterium]